MKNEKEFLSMVIKENGECTNAHRKYIFTPRERGAPVFCESLCPIKLRLVKNFNKDITCAPGIEYLLKETAIKIILEKYGETELVEILL